MFTVFYGQGVLESLVYREAAEAVALQFADSVTALCPQCDLILLKNVDPQVLYSLGSEFTVCETKFGCVGTKGTLSHCTHNQENLCRFSVDNWATVTFACYDSLFALERDLATLCQPPFHLAHLLCVVIRRTVNWKTMVYKCSRALHIQYSEYPASQCQAQDDIVLLGWQRYSPCYTESLKMYKALPLIIPLLVSGCPDSRNVKTFNSKPVYVACYTKPVKNNKPAVRTKQFRSKTLASVNPPVITSEQPLTAEPLQDVEKESSPVSSKKPNFFQDNPFNTQEVEKKQEPEVMEEWVLTAVYIEE